MTAFSAIRRVLGAVGSLIWLAACSSDLPSASTSSAAGTPGAVGGMGSPAVGGAALVAGGGASSGGLVAASGAGQAGMPTVPSAGAAGMTMLDPWHDNWPQAGGPEGTWRVAGKTPTRFSVALNENIAWKAPLPGGGQGGIAVWGDRLFLTTFEPYTPGASKMSANIVGYALDATNGKILWSVKLMGSTPSPMMYAYSDSTSWTPIADGEHVWFFNSSGAMGCWDFSGKEVWRRSFPAPDEPFNKQHEPFMAGDAIVSAEPLAPGEPGYSDDKKIWNYLRASTS